MHSSRMRTARSLRTGGLSGGSLSWGDLCPVGVSVWGSLSRGGLSRGGLSRGDLCLEGVSVQGGSLGDLCLAEGDLCLGEGGFCRGGSLSGVSVGGRETPVSCQGDPRVRETPMNIITDMCKNITFPQRRCGR